MHEKSDNYYSVTDLIDILEVTRRTILKYIKKGKLRAFKLGNQWRVTEEELQKFINRNSNY
ncbi:MAG: helix-turn-helix domain-containing protein [Tenericutes bacterium]|nr:helix-turn-helix domain-containing protein [Mycoplasmatota bacterium]